MPSSSFEGEARAGVEGAEEEAVRRFFTMVLVVVLKTSLLTGTT